MNRTLIKGKLLPSNPALSVARANLYRDMIANRMRGTILWDSNWDTTGIDFTRSAPVLKGRDDALGFITTLNNVMKGDAATELGLNGAFTVIIETNDEPLVFRITVQNSKVSYKEAQYGWAEEVTV